MGRIEAGSVSLGDEVAVYPSGQKARVTRIFVAGKPSEVARARQSVSICLDKEIDISRGDLIAKVNDPVTKTQKISARLCWLSEDSLEQNRRYLLKLSTKIIPVRIDAIHSVLNVNTQKDLKASTVNLNDIVKVTINLQSPIMVDNYQVVRELGSFILIDEITNNTVGAGLIYS
jgi:sulfate adenylyltransferase subunit 1